LPSSAALVDQQGDEERIMMPMPLSDSDDEMLLMLGQRPSPQQSYWIQRLPSAQMVDRQANRKLYFIVILFTLIILLLLLFIYFIYYYYCYSIYHYDYYCYLLFELIFYYF
jgi:hypothetical protein